MTNIQVRTRRLLRFCTDQLAAAYRWILTAVAREITAECMARRSLVVAPHPDDETLGCGGTIARKRSVGTDVMVVIVTDGRLSHRSDRIGPDELAAIRTEESRRACTKLGVPRGNVVTLDIAEGTLDATYVERILRDLIDEFEPEEILAPALIDAHPDHRLLNRQTRRAIRASGRAVVLLEYPIWMWTPSAWWNEEDGPVRRLAKVILRPLDVPLRLGPRVVDISPALDLKQAALAEYRSQMTNLSGEDGWATMDPAFLRHFSGPSELFFSG